MNKERVFKLKDPDITKREYDKILEEISNQTNIIWRYICKKQNRKLNWWAFCNDEEYGNGNGSSGGYFRIEYDENYIEIMGLYLAGYYEKSCAYDALKNEDYTFLDGFQTELLWDDNWMKTVDDQIEKEKKLIKEYTEKKQDTVKSNKEKRLQLAESIKNKLTKEELKFVKTNLSAQEKKILNASG